MEPDRLEELIGRRLRELPGPEAPATLWPRVRVAVERRLAQPWYRRAWREWPVAQRAASSALVLAALGGGLVVGAADPGLPARIAGLVRVFGISATAGAGVLVAVAEGLRRALVEPLALYVLAWAFLTGTVVAVLGAIFRQALILGHTVTIGGVSES